MFLQSSIELKTNLEAHEAVRPTNFKKQQAGNTADQKAHGHWDRL